MSLVTSMSSRHGVEEPSPKARRTNVACLRCRERKVRCSGTCPCAHCVRRSAECVFEQEDRKILISESYLNELKRKATGSEGGDDCEITGKRRRGSSGSSQRRGPTGIAGADVGDPNDQGIQGRDLDGTTVGASIEAPGDDGLPTMTNPLVAAPSKFVTDFQGRRRFLGPSSTWAYSRHVMGMIRQYLDQHESPEVPLNADGAAFSIEFPNMKQLGSISMENLPSLDYALYLTNTVKFHITQTYHLFEEQTFMHGLFSLYNDGPRPITPKNRMWYVQYFLVMALGKALLMKGLPKASPPGSEYFMRAMELYPDVNGLYQDPILSIEVCCGLALYLQSVDHRNSAYVYLGLALRIALSQGLHRDLAGDLDGAADVSRYRSAWWTLYILDRKFSSLMGAPSSVHDSDISVPLPTPNQSVQRSSALEMHVKLSRLIAKVLNTVYGIDGKLDSLFLKNVQSTLRELAGLAVELNSASDLKLDSSSPVSRVSATLNLCYHQCIVLATRPLLMCLLRDKLEKKVKGDKSNREIVEPVKALLKTSCDSANKSLRILTTLQSQDLLESFLPFDLDHAFSAGFVLSLISAIQPFPDAIDDSYLETTFSLLDAAIAGGNVPARFRRQELERLHDMLRLIAQQDQSNGYRHSYQHGVLPFGQGDIPGQGVSPNQMLTVASLLDCYPPLDVGADLVDNWLWEAGSLEGLPMTDNITE